MRGLKVALFLLGAIALVTGQTAQPLVSTPGSTTQPLNLGLTFQATVFPSYDNNWAGRFSCNNCNPFVGDQPCTKSLPILCISNYKASVRPLTTIAIEYTPFAVLDGGYYDGWTGGVFTVTLPVRGSDISSYKVGDDLCKGYFGNNSHFAKFDDGLYMDYMNQPPQKTWWLWDWGKTKKGGWNMWGYFNHHYRGRAWVWVDNQPNGNCGV
jgi:hypothetical protein